MRHYLFLLQAALLVMTLAPLSVDADDKTAAAGLIRVSPPVDITPYQLAVVMAYNEARLDVKAATSDYKRAVMVATAEIERDPKKAWN